VTGGESREMVFEKPKEDTTKSGMLQGARKRNEEAERDSL
jgi:hypothetical protein